MSIGTDATAVILVAAEAEVDPSGILRGSGLGVRAVRLGPTGQTPPLTVVVLVDLPADQAGREFELAVELRRPDTGEVVEVPDLNGAPGPFRIAQRVRAERGAFDGVELPAAAGARAQFLLAVPEGVPLEPGLAYRWFLEIDGRHQAGWTQVMYVVPAS
jgi:hypothetical protein